jgi:glycosyltransferase involved in cell wall biosynthesis
MAALESKATRWREVLRVWDGDSRVASLTVVDYPRFGPRPRVRTSCTWLARASLREVCVLGRQRVGPETGPGWRVTAALLRRTLPGKQSRRVVIAAAPFWIPLLPLIPAARRAFDGVDDWRAYDGAASIRGRVEQGYASLEELDVVTAVSSVLAGRLSASDIRVVPNGVHRAGLAFALPSKDPRLPDEPFAVYVGNVEQRVDLGLLEATAAVLPVVVAGPAEGEIAARLRSGPVIWLGQVHADEVPGLLARASVGLIPHLSTPLTESMDPMKLREYLGAGLPVVSTPINGMTQWTALEVASGADFVTAVRRAVRRGRGSVPEELVDWTVVADTLLRTSAGELL